MTENANPHAEIVKFVSNFGRVLAISNFLATLIFIAVLKILKLLKKFGHC